jgi:DNA-binding MarR family transcriptional regulator
MQEPQHSQPPLTDKLVLQLLRTHELIRIKHKNIPARYISIFLYIASHDPCQQKAIEDGLGILQPTCSRGTDFLSKQNRLGQPGLDWIKKEQDPLNATQKVLTLTQEGKAVIRQMKETVYGQT